MCVWVGLYVEWVDGNGGWYVYVCCLFLIFFGLVCCFDVVLWCWGGF